MALLPCPECGRDLSEDATSCPHCGKSRMPYGLIGLLGAIVIFGWVCYGL